MLRGPTTEDYLCEKMVELMETNPCLQIKVMELTQYAKVSRGTFYLYFNSICDVIQKLEDDYIAGAKQLASKSPTSPHKSYDDTRAQITYLKENMRVYRALVGPNGDPAFQPRLMNALASWFYDRNLKDRGSKLTPTERRLVYEHVMGGRWAIYKWWAFHEDEMTVDEMTQMIRRIDKQMVSLLE